MGLGDQGLSHPVLLPQALEQGAGSKPEPGEQTSTYMDAKAAGSGLVDYNHSASPTVNSV